MLQVRAISAELTIPSEEDHKGYSKQRGELMIVWPVAAAVYTLKPKAGLRLSLWAVLWAD